MTQTQRRREFDRLIALKDGAGGRFKVGEITADAIRANLESLSPGAASNRLKAWRAVMSHAVDRSWVDRSPAHDVRAPQPKSGDGHRAWTKDDIEAFRAALPIGTRHRLAMELAYWTGARRGDLVQLGPQHIGVDGWLQYRQSKTGRDVAVPFRADQVPHPALAKEWAHLERALVLARPGLLYLATQTGAPRSSNAVGEWFRRACKVAGLPDGCSMHGLRKARASALAELGWSEGQIMAWTGHDTMKEVVRYTRSARRRVMIRGALGPSDRNVVALRSSEEQKT
ncbi:MAG: tyrosine-type recombinase/integrase, partial [Pseudomonadota bacterium]